MTERDRIDEQLLAMAYGRLQLSLLLNVAVVLLFHATMVERFVPWRVGQWALIGAFVIGLRQLDLSAFRRRRDAQAEHWSRRFLLSAVAAGTAWAMGPLMLIDSPDRPETYLLVLTMVSLSAVSTATMAAHWPAMLSFQLCTLLPTAWALAATGGGNDALAGLVVLACLAALALAGRGSHAALRAQVATERQLAASLQEAAAARDASDAASRAKSRFLANMSHELRTPLNAVIGAAQLMKADGRDAEQRLHLVDAIQRSGSSLLSLIESILDLSRIEAGAMELQQRDFHLVECVESALATAGVSARAKGLQLACVVAADLPAWRCGDEARLRQVLLNLLGNAIKFTGEGEVVVRVARASQGDGVSIGIADTGIGIAPDALARVFEPFRQADEGTDRRFGGSGLGLAIVHQLVQAMGGTVAVRSEPGRGSCFTIELPLPPAQQPPAEVPPLALRVAYVEPHEASAEALHGLLLRLGCEPCHCRDEAALLAWARRSAGDERAWLLVDTDRAPAQAWLEEAAPWLEPERVVGMSSVEAWDADQVRQRCRLPRQLIKPLTRPAVTSRLVGAGAEPGLSRPMPLAPLSEQQLQAMPRVLLVEDDRLNQAIVGRLLQHAGYRVSTADDGHAALQALREQAYDLVLMDWQMPDLDGLEVTRRIRDGDAGPAARALPIVALTANAFAEDREACLRAGMNDFLTKPVNAAALTRTIERWLRREDGSAGHVDKVDRRPAAASVRAPVFDPAVLAALPMVADGSDPGYGREVLALFLDDAPALLARIGQAEAAGDLAALVRGVHTLKSSAAAVGALALSEQAAQSEVQLRQSGAAAAGLMARLDAGLQVLRAQVRPLLADNVEGALPS